MPAILGLKGVRAILARLIFATHSMLAIGCVVSRGCPQLVRSEDNWIFWSFAGVPFLLFVEGAATVLLRNGDEYRWFCPCVFIFLCGSVPPIWFLEMTTTFEQIKVAFYNYTTTTVTTESPTSPFTFPTEPLLSNVTENIDRGRQSGDIGFIIPKVILPDIIPKSQEQRVQIIEQTLLVVLIVGRWLLPKGEITRDQLSQLLLAYLAISADIVELFSVFVDVEEVRKNMRLTITLLTVWSVSLIQFFMVLTTVKGQKARYCYKESSAKNQVIIDLVAADAVAVSRSDSYSSVE